MLFRNDTSKYAQKQMKTSGVKTICFYLCLKPFVLPKLNVLVLLPHEYCMVGILVLLKKA